MAKRKFSFNALISNNKLVFILALLVSVALWITVSPSGTRTISGVKVTVLTENTPAGESGFQVVDGQGQEVAVSISGSFTVLNRISASDIQIDYSLAGVTASGEYDLQLSAKPLNRKDFTVTSITPDTIRVRFDQSSSKSFTVQAKAIGAMAETGKVLEPAVVADSKQAILQITGPKTDIDRIATVQAVAQVNKTMRQTESFPSTLVLLDADGKDLLSEDHPQKLNENLLQFSFKDPQITVKISKTKTVKVVPVFSDLPEYYTSRTVPYSLSVSSVSVIGTPETVDEMTELELSPISFFDLKNTKNVFTLDLTLPLGVRVSDAVEQVTVTVDLSGLQSATKTVSRFQFQNTPEGMTATVVTQSQKVTLVGSRGELRDLNASDVTLVCDMEGVNSTKGEHIVPAHVQVAGNGQVWGVGEYEVQVRLE